MFRPDHPVFAGAARIVRAGKSSPGKKAARRKQAAKAKAKRRKK